MIIPTMKSHRNQILTLVLVVLITQPAHARVIPGRWEKVSNLDLRMPITVELKNGDRTKGQFRGLSPSDLELLSPAGRAVIPKTDIQTITAPSKDGLGNGVGIGAAIGAGLGLGAFGLAARTRGGVDSATLPATLLVIGGLGAGIGAGIGVAVDAATKTEDIVLYEAPGNPQRSKHRDPE